MYTMLLNLTASENYNGGHAWFEIVYNAAPPSWSWKEAAMCTVV